MPLDINYESMFGGGKISEVENFTPRMLPINLNEQTIKKVMDKARRENKWVLAFVIGTKPCFYKFYGSVMAADKAGLPYFVIDSNQHYDERLTYGRYEFDFHNRIAINLSIRGDLVQKSIELMSKVSWFARYLKERWPEVIVVPVVLGDTILTSIVPPAWMFSRMEKAIHNEAGLRSMTPEIMKSINNIDLETFIEEQFDGKWSLLRNEPFPEQWDTFTSSAGAEFLFVPVELNKRHLIREGYPEENIFVIGGVVVDALEAKRAEKPSKSIFNIYPKLKKGKWIRMDIHRRENLTPRRFKAIVAAVVGLVERGYNVNFIEMNATKHALEAYNLKKDLLRLKEKDNFLYTQVWPEFTHVIEFFESDRCFAALTDSGGVQEELNLLNKICLTCRMSTDRPETVMDSYSNLLIPPIDSDFIIKMVEYVYRNKGLQEKMRNGKRLYGEDVGGKFIKIVQELMLKRRPFSWAHETLGLWKEDTRQKNYF